MPFPCSSSIPLNCVTTTANARTVEQQAHWTAARMESRLQAAEVSQIPRRGERSTRVTQWTPGRLKPGLHTRRHSHLIQCPMT
jgi:hypothetical protein